MGNPLRLRSREWIINEKQSDKNDRWLSAINNGLVLDDIFSRASIPGFTSGGRYEDFSNLTQSSRLDIERRKQGSRRPDPCCEGPHDVVLPRDSPGTGRGAVCSCDSRGAVRL